MADAIINLSFDDDLLKQTASAAFGGLGYGKTIIGRALCAGTPFVRFSPQHFLKFFRKNGLQVN